MNLATILKAIYNNARNCLQQTATPAGYSRGLAYSRAAPQLSLASLLLLGVVNVAQAADDMKVTGVGADSSAMIDGSECVIALHGLARSAASMEKLVEAVASAGYLVANIDYPSREKTVNVLAGLAVKQGLDACRQQGAETIHFVSHSMGGILIRQYLKENSLDNLGRVVMLAPPNQGSEVVDALRDTPGFELINGPAGMQLGTGADDVPRTLGSASFDLGVIAGTRTINLILSTYLPDPDDGKVSVASARVAGMCDFLTVEVSHPFIMKSDEVIEQVLHYFANGRFSRKSAIGSVSSSASESADTLPVHCTQAG